jgi:hypothetical protein
MLSERIEWVAGVDKTNVDLRDGFYNHAVRLSIIKLALKFNDCPIGVVDARRQHRGDVKQCARIFCEKRSSAT